MGLCRIPTLLEVFNLILRLADDYSNDCLIKPCRLRCQLLRILLKFSAIGYVALRLCFQTFFLGFCLNPLRLSFASAEELAYASGRR